MSQSFRLRTPYGGSESNLVISLDLGTTFSGASWALLNPGEVPQIWDVSEYREDFPFAKVPTVLYYDRGGKLRAVGSETLDTGVIAKALQQEWTRVEWFKLLLCPAHSHNIPNRAPKTEIPGNKKVAAVIADFLRYMGNLACRHFQDTMDKEGNIWNKVKDRVIYILSYTNGWNTFQHQLMRDAAIRAGLVQDSDEGRNRIIFVSEGEASLHWCMSKGIGRKDFKDGSHFVVVDAGGGTIDISSFRMVGTVPPEFEESSVPECCLEGSAFVTQAFRNFVQHKLKDSAFKDPETVQRIVETFDKEFKCTFRDRKEDTFVRFGRSQDNDPKSDIKGGQFLIRGEELARFFEPACRAIVASVRAKAALNSRTSVMLVGGLAGNQYLFQEVQDRLRLLGPNIAVYRPRDSWVKASAQGAICFYLDRTVKARMAKWTYGISCVHDFDPTDPKHAQRQSRVLANPVTGKPYLDGGFFVTLKKGTVVRETALTHFPFWHSQPGRTAATLSVVLECYQGDVLDIQFRDEDDEVQFKELCQFKAVIPETSLVRVARGGKKKTKRFLRSSQYYYVSNFQVVVSFGATEFKCYIEWKDEKGRTQSGPITPIWDE